MRAVALFCLVVVPPFYVTSLIEEKVDVPGCQATCNEYGYRYVGYTSSPLPHSRGGRDECDCWDSKEFHHRHLDLPRIGGGTGFFASVFDRAVRLLAAFGLPAAVLFVVFVVKVVRSPDQRSK